jgi:hypothetical protein
MEAGPVAPQGTAQSVSAAPSGRVVAAFIALAVLAGPVSTFAFTPFASSVQWQTTLGSALSSVLAGTGLLLICVARKRRMLHAKEWLVLLVLLMPQWLAALLTAPIVRSFPWLHETRWGLAFLLTLAAPLSLALLSALQIVSVQVPRAVVGATIAGIAAVCLVIPTDAYAIDPKQTPALVLQLLLNILIVFTWTYAAPRLAGVSALAAAGSYLLLSALGNAGLSLLFERSARQPIEWQEQAIPLLLQAAVIACLWVLWFWLLERMTLAAFGMRALAMWTASILPGFALPAFFSGRVDVALVIAVGAIVIALRARVTDERPTALGLGRA